MSKEKAGTKDRVGTKEHGTSQAGDSDPGQGQPRSHGRQSNQPWEKIDRDVSRRYKVGSRIGRGCYGVVWEVTEAAVKDPRSFAMKKILNGWRNSTDAQRTYREVCYLEKFHEHQNIVQLHEVLCSPDDRHIYLLMELMDCDLQKALRCQSLRAIHRPLIAYQVLRALKYIHSAGVMHRDVKPANILLNDVCKVVLTDFGWARASPFTTAPGEGLLTEYASSRWYRSPEMLLGAKRYTNSVDIWALGCVVGEMHCEGSPLMPGTSNIDMVDKIVEILGKPLPMDIAAMEATPYANFTLDGVPSGPPHHPISGKVSANQPDLVDFLQLCLQYNPGKRLTAPEALEHPYMGQFCDPDDEPVYGSHVKLPLPDAEKFTIEQYRDQAYADIIGMENVQRRLSRTGKVKAQTDNDDEEKGDDAMGETLRSSIS